MAVVDTVVHMAVVDTVVVHMAAVSVVILIVVDTVGLLAVSIMVDAATSSGTFGASGPLYFF